ncbi:cytochrome c3 family protein [uncultured Desulfovibrio sp.]|uniref:cytochrome c3 family protein n=1 Tax=uncultured Desulfovibrio sp. TaxID=167968 RepID=UPI0026084637|nr:cytochrome c3 family protein [uncultured Desulfovibrio sp.]
MHRTIVRGACTCCCSLLLFTLVFMCPQPAGSEEILTVRIPAIGNPTMPRVIFNHDRHVAFVETHEGDCSRCHRMTPEGLSTAVLDVRLQKEDRQVPYLHATCTDCHKASGHGPALAECRVCHAQGNVLRAMKK